jgi:hypothetical protein
MKPTNDELIKLLDDILNDINCIQSADPSIRSAKEKLVSKIESSISLLEE